MCLHVEHCKKYIITGYVYRAVHILCLTIAHDCWTTAMLLNTFKFLDKNYQYCMQLVLKKRKLKPDSDVDQSIGNYILSC